MGGMARITVTEVILDQAQIASLIGECKSAGMAQHVGMNRGKLGASCRRCDNPVHGLPG